jgi:outer membrane murein-binding lipoprotein Lpp
MSAMNKTTFRGAVVVGLMALAGCATVQSGEEPRVASESQTGSNLPKKSRTDKVQTINADGMQPLPPPSQPRAGGGG